jgi:hypothetical protein
LRVGHVRQRLGRVARLLQVAEREQVRLVLVVAAELEEEQLQPAAGQPGELLQARLGQDRHPQAELGELLLADPVDAVARRDVADLVAEHAGHLRLGVEVGHHPRVTKMNPPGSANALTGRRPRP